MTTLTLPLPPDAGLIPPDTPPRWVNTSPDWEPGDPLYRDPRTESHESGWVRQLFSFEPMGIAHYGHFDIDETRLCTPCEVLWVGDTHCWNCGGYTRPTPANASLYNRILRIFT